MNDHHLVDYGKDQLARIQLERAISLFLDDRDWVCAITLAGAAEELLARLLERQGKRSVLGELVESSIATGDVVFGETWRVKWFSELFTYPRNELKHIGDGTNVSVSREMAMEALRRAIQNYLCLAKSTTPTIDRYLSEFPFA